MTLSQINIHMINRHLVELDGAEDTEMILQPSRLTVSFVKYYNLEVLKTKTRADVMIEPIDIRVGMRELL